VCNTSDDCDAGAGFYCRGTDFRCAPFAREGEMCIGGSFDPVRGVVQSEKIPCDPRAGLWCDGAPGFCRTLPTNGTACLQMRPCRPTTGALCDPDPALALSWCGMGFNGSGVCETAAQASEACGGAGLPPCGEGLFCASSTGATGAGGIGGIGGIPGNPG